VVLLGEEGAQMIDEVGLVPFSIDHGAWLEPSDGFTVGVLVSLDGFLAYQFGDLDRSTSASEE
jgi:hypothetical protein